MFGCLTLVHLNSELYFNSAIYECVLAIYVCYMMSTIAKIKEI